MLYNEGNPFKKNVAIYSTKNFRRKAWSERGGGGEGPDHLDPPPPPPPPLSAPGAKRSQDRLPKSHKTAVQICLRGHETDWMPKRSRDV